MNRDKKKVLMVCESFGGGVFTYVSQLCNDMINDFDVYLAYSLRPQTPKNYKELLDSRIHLIEISNFNIGFNLLNDYRIIKRLQRIADTVEPDIIHLHSSIAGGIGRLAFKNTNAKVVYTPHGYAFVLMKPSIKIKLYKIIERVLGRTSNAITLTCSKSEDEVASTLTKRHAYIETGINLQRLTESLKNLKVWSSNGKFVVYTLGRITGQKRPELFNKIAELVPEAEFLWIGDGEEKELLSSSNIKVTGWKSREEALAIAKGANAYVLCSRGEAIAESLIENMYIKNVSLVSNVMGNVSVINDGVNGYICKTPNEYAQRIKQVMQENPQSVIKNAYNDILNVYNSEVMKKKYIKFYDSLIDESK